MSKLRKKPIIKQGKGMERSRTPVFICSAHKPPVHMVFDPAIARWVCPEAGCTQTRQPKTGDDTMLLKETPRLVVGRDEDGDMQLYLHWSRAKILFPLDYKSASLSPNRPGSRTLRMEFQPEDITNVDGEL